MRFAGGHFVNISASKRVAVDNDRVTLESDSEGGNIRWQAPDGTTWEIDALNGNCRLFTYANGVRTAFIISKMGEVSFPCGFINTSTIMMRGASSTAAGKEGLCPAPSAGNLNRFLRADGAWAYTGGDSSSSNYYIGYTVSLYGTSKSVKISNNTYLLFIQARADGKNGTVPETFLWGFNLTTILANLGIFGKVVYKWGKYMILNENYASALAGVLGYGTGFTQKHTNDPPNGYEIITPGRYYKTDGAYGEWSNKSIVAQTDNFWDCVLLVDVL